MENKTVYAKFNKARVSPKKVAPVLNLVRGKDALEAARILKFDTTKGAAMTLKVLNSAIANAETNHDLKKENLVVSDLRVSAGPSQKGGRATARGKFAPRIKRSSRIVVGLSERN